MSHGLGHVTWYETFAVCFRSEKYIPFKPWNIDSAVMTCLWRMRVTLFVPGAQSLASLSLAAFHPGSWEWLEEALGSVWSWGRAYPCWCCISTCAPAGLRMESLCLDQAAFSFFFFICLPIEELCGGSVLISTPLCDFEHVSLGLIQF